MTETIIKKTLVCRDVIDYQIDTNMIASHVPSAGDVAIVEIVELGKVVRIQNDLEHLTSIFPGDRILAAFGNRYATSQVEAYVPDFSLTELHLVGAGGVLGVVHSQNVALKDLEPTAVRVIGYATKGGKVVNTNFLDMPRHTFAGDFAVGKPKVILSLGSSMDSGKTTIAGGLARGLMLAGNRVAYMKLTGTAYTKDRKFVQDCGAFMTTDFSHAGFTSTYMCDHDEIMDIYETLMREVIFKNPCDYLIIEVADGLFQRENKTLLPDERFRDTVDEVIFSGGDSLSAIYGIKYLEEMGYQPFALSGKFTMSPLLVREVQEYTSIPVLTLDELMMADVIKYMKKDKINGKRIHQNRMQAQYNAA